MDKSYTIIEHGFAMALENGEIPLDGLRVHICFYNDECFALDYYGELSMDLTTETLDWFLANECLDWNKDLTTKFTEVWYETSSGKNIEIKRKETIYSDELIRVFAGLKGAVLL